jgi:hypothetical protein
MLPRNEAGRSGLAGLAGACFRLSGDGPLAYDDAIIAAVKLPAQWRRGKNANKSNTEGDKP